MPNIKGDIGNRKKHGVTSSRGLQSFRSSKILESRQKEKLSLYSCKIMMCVPRPFCQIVQNFFTETIELNRVLWWRASVVISNLADGERCVSIFLRGFQNFLQCPC